MLADDGVDLGCVVRTADPTTLALASLDAIGAGDAFGGGFLAWWISHGLDRAELACDELVVEVARFASVVAARTVARTGASPPELLSVSEERPLDAASV
jgi:fructokinase